MSSQTSTRACSHCQGTSSLMTSSSRTIDSQARLGKFQHIQYLTGSDISLKKLLYGFKWITHHFNSLKVLDSLLLLPLLGNVVFTHSSQALGHTFFMPLPKFMVTKTGCIVGDVDFAIVAPLFTLAYPVLHITEQKQCINTIRQPKEGK